MAVPKKRNRSDYTAGLVVLSCAALVLVGTGLIAHFRHNPIGYQEYVLEFSLGAGIQGLEVGSPIRFGGLNVGEVTHLDYRDGQLRVNIALKQAIRLYPGVQIQRASSLIGGPSMLVLTSAGNEQAEPLSHNEVIHAAPSAGGIATVIGSENAMHLEKIQKSFQNAFAGLQEIGLRAGKVGQDAGKLADFAKEIEADAEKWRPKITNISNNLDSIQSKGNAIKKQYEVLSEGEGPDGTTRPGRVLIETYDRIEKTLADKRWTTLKENWEEVFAQAREAKTEFEADVVPKVEELVKRAEASWGNLLKTKDSLEKLATKARTSLEVFMANSTLSAQQLKLAESEILGALGLPLLEHPSLSDENLVVEEQAIGDWARAAFSLRESLQALENISIKEGDDAEATLARLVDTLRAALADYEDAQAHFLALPKPKSGDK